MVADRQTGNHTSNSDTLHAGDGTPSSAPRLKIGVLALQGAFAEHSKMVRQLGADAVEVRRPDQLDDLDGLIIPGGESTSMGLVAQRWQLVEPLRAWVHRGKPTFGTCAGMILLAARAANQKLGGQPLIGGLDVTVNRNFFGRQVDSFETNLIVPELGEGTCHAVFIRAPAITEIGPSVQSLAQIERGAPVHVAVRDGMILATAFHPELTADLRWHTLFLEMARAYRTAHAPAPR
ncbi:MAG: pyridoxal 5'-phosphate synthase glutaminase subunit PdxT [Litorilinea sp.]